MAEETIIPELFQDVPDEFKELKKFLLFDIPMQEEKSTKQSKIKPSPFEGYKSLPDSFVKCMEGPNRGKPGPCPDANRAAAKQAKQGGGGISERPGIVKQVYQEHKKREQEYTDFLRDEYIDKRANLSQATQAYREGKISPEDYHDTIMEYEKARKEYVSRMGMSGIKKVAIALGVAIGAAGAAYVGYKYSETIKGIAEKLGGFLKENKKAAVVSALGGISTVAEALKGNSTIDPLANTAKRLTEIMMTEEAAKDPELEAALEDVKKHGNKAAAQSINYVYNRKKNVIDELRKKNVDKERLKAMLDRIGDSTVDVEDLLNNIAGKHEKGETEKWGSPDYQKKVQATETFRRSNIPNFAEYREKVWTEIANDPRANFYIPREDDFRYLVDIGKRRDRTPDEEAQYQTLIKTYEEYLDGNNIDPYIVAAALSKVSDRDNQTLTYKEFKADAEKARGAKSKKKKKGNP